MERVRRILNWPPLPYLVLFLMAIAGLGFHQKLYKYSEYFIQTANGDDNAALPKIYQQHRNFPVLFGIHAGILFMAGVASLRIRLLRSTISVCIAACSLILMQFLSTLFVAAPILVEGGPLPIMKEDLDLLRDNPKITLYSLSPVIASNNSNPPSSSFHKFKILGETVLEPSELSVAKDLIQSIQQTRVFPGMCFQPRHGIRISGSKGQLDLVVCFECSRVEVHGSNGESAHSVPKWVEPALNAILDKRGIPRDKRAEASKQ